MRTGQGHGTETWSSPEWRAEVVAWLDEQLAAAGIERVGEVEQPHLRPCRLVAVAEQRNKGVGPAAGVVEG